MLAQNGVSVIIFVFMMIFGRGLECVLSLWYYYGRVLNDYNIQTSMQTVK